VLNSFSHCVTVLKKFTNPDSSKIKTFAILWLCGIAVVFVLVSVALIVSTSMLDGMSRRIFVDSRGLDADNQLESRLLNQRREDLLWRITKDPSHHQNSEQEIRAADKLIEDLHFEVTSREEMILLDDVKAKYQQFRAAALSNPPLDPHALSVHFNQLLAALRLHRSLNSKQMEETIAYSDRLNNYADLFSIAVVFILFVGLGGGAVALWSRIFRPTLLLAQAAQSFGAGNLQARAPVLRNDEMGTLNQTFNSMADSICSREQERRDLIAMVAHDIRSPLGNVSLAAQMLQEVDLEPNKKVLLEQLLRNVRRTEIILDDLLDFTQAESGLMSLEQEELDLTVLVGELVREQADVCQTHHFKFEGKGKCLISGDRERLSRVVSNLLSNAIKYSAPGRAIAVKVEANDKTGVIAIQDQGVGIAAEDLERIFQPFTRLESTRSMAQGTGIGLTSVRKIVEAHQGTIEVTSEPGMGTTFKVNLPLSVGAFSLSRAKSVSQP